MISITVCAGIALLITAGVFFVSKQPELKEVYERPTSSIPITGPALTASASPSGSETLPTNENLVIAPPLTLSASPSEPETPSTDDSLVTRAKECVEKNEETVGWIRIEGTPVDYPVVQAKDNDYYLTHDAEKQSNKHGAIFLDYRCDPNSLKGNNILFGHHMKDGSMFASLVQYKDETFFKSHPTIELATLEKRYQWEIFAVFVTDTDYDYLQTEFTGRDEYCSFLKTMQKKSIFKTDISLSYSDDILILSTCTYEFEDARFVVAARMKQ